MDVYKYIRSKDVREYNKKIKHEFNTLESTFLVWRNYDISLCEKHEAWRQICSEMPDTEIKKRLNVDYAPSLYELIELFIKTDKFLINEFYREDDCAIYGYRFYCEGDNGWSEDFRTPYSCFEKLKKALEEDFDLPIVAIEYRKNPLSEACEYLTCITNKMLENKQSIDTVLSEFINFVGNLPIATSNKQFDISFINVALKKLGKPLLDNKIIDL